MRQTIGNISIIEQKQKTAQFNKLVWRNDVSFQHLDMLLAADVQHVAVAVQELCGALPLLDDGAVLQRYLGYRLADVFRLKHKGLGAHLEPSVLLFQIITGWSRVGRDEDRAEVLEVDFAGFED